MLRDPLTTTALRWGNGGTLTLTQAALQVTAAIPIVGATQLNMIFDVSIAGGVIGALISLFWSADNVLYGQEMVEELGALVGNAQRYTLREKVWGPIVTSTFSIARPCAAHWCKIGIITTAAPGAADYVQCQLERQRPDQLGAQAGA